MKKFVCPLPIAWNKVHESLERHWIAAGSNGEKPPTPLILNDWSFSNDVDKRNRWLSTVRWAEKNNLTHLIPKKFPSKDSYMTEHLSDYEIGPGGGPLYLPWNFKSRPIISKEKVELIFKDILLLWNSNKHEKIFQITKPLKLSGKKSRALICEVPTDQQPPWGAWELIKKDEISRSQFRTFRSSINISINQHAHKIDHIIFKSVQNKKGYK